MTLQKVAKRLVKGKRMIVCPVFKEAGNQASPKDGITDQQVEESKAALCGLGLNDDVRTE